MRKVTGKKLTAVLLAAAMCMGTAACGEDGAGQGTGGTGAADGGAADGGSSGSEGTADAEGQSGEYIYLTYLEPGGSGLYEEEQSLTIKKIAEETGIFVQGTNVTDDKYSVLMASRDLEADIVSVRTIDQQALIEGGLLIPLDDLIDQYAPHIKETAENSLNYWREYKSFGKGELFLIPSHNAADLKEVTDSAPYNYGVAPYIRWDYYKELGYPEVTNEDDFLNMLKAMQDAHPTTEDGKKTYAMSVVHDILWSFFTPYPYWNGYEVVNNLVARNAQDDLVNNALDEDFIGWRAVNFYNKAYRMGIYDPECLTQKGENVSQKVANSQTFYTENSWNNYNQVLGEVVGPQAGFEVLMSAFPAAYAGGTSSYGWGFTLGITSSCKDPVAAIKWIDYLYSEEGARLLYSGVQGVHWDYDEDGVPYLFEETMKMYQDEEWNKKNGISKYHNWIGIDNMIKHSDGYPVDLFYLDEVRAMANKPIDNEYCEYYDIAYPGQAGKAADVDVIWWMGDAGSLMPVMPDDLKRIQTRAEDAMLKAIPQMILASTEEEFQQKRQELISQLESLGTQGVIDWIYTEFEKSKEEVEKLSQ